VKRSSFIQISVIDPLLSDDKIDLIKTICGTSHFQLTEQLKERKRRLYLAIENRIDSLSELIKVAFLMDSSTEQFLIKIYKEPVRILRA
jgi:hypothetical protein